MFVVKTKKLKIKNIKKYKRVNLKYGQRFIRVEYGNKDLFFTNKSFAKFKEAQKK